MRSYYFAFGSNLEPEQMRRRAPDSRACCRVRLCGHRLAFRGFSASWRGAVATIEKKKGESVPGMLYTISDEDLARLDAAEGHPTYYRRTVLTVVAEDGRRFDAYAYVLADARPSPPSLAYAAAILRGYRAHDLEEGYLMRRLSKYLHNKRRKIPAGTRRVFVYGTLMRGERLDHFLASSVFLGHAISKPQWTLVTLGAFPAILESGSTAIWGEVYAVDDETLERLDRVEGHPHFYRRSPLTLSDGTAVEAYVLARTPAKAPPIPSGNWRAR